MEKSQLESYKAYLSNESPISWSGADLSSINVDPFSLTSSFGSCFQEDEPNILCQLPCQVCGENCSTLLLLAAHLRKTHGLSLQKSANEANAHKMRPQHWKQITRSQVHNAVRSKAPGSTPRGGRPKQTTESEEDEIAEWIEQREKKRRPNYKEIIFQMNQNAERKLQNALIHQTGAKYSIKKSIAVVRRTIKNIERKKKC